MKDIVRRCRFKTDGGTFTLTLWDTGRTAEYGKTILGYKLVHNGLCLFEGEDYACSPLHAIDSDEAVKGIMGFLTLRPGDTDADYFAKYNRYQHTFCALHAEDLAMTVMARFGE